MQKAVNKIQRIYLSLRDWDLLKVSFLLLVKSIANMSSFNEFFKKQQELKNAFIPTSIQAYLEQHRKIKVFLHPMADSTLYQIMKDSAELKKVFTVFDRLEAIPKSNLINEGLRSLGDISRLSLSYRYFTFDIQLEDEEKEQSKAVVVNEAKRIKRIITDIYSDPTILNIIQPREFEEVIAELLSAQGFAVELTKQTRDNGYDIIALKYIDRHNPLKFLVECKRYRTSKVGVEIIRSFKDVIATEKANRGIIVTTSYFTTDAQKKQKEIPYLLEFKDKDAVIGWVQDYQANLK